MVSSDQVFRWVDKNDNIDAPIGAVTGACSLQGRRIYVIRAPYNGRTVAGNYEEGNDYAEIEIYGARMSLDWEYLVSTEEVTGTHVHNLMNYHIALSISDWWIIVLRLNCNSA